MPWMPVEGGLASPAPGRRLWSCYGQPGQAELSLPASTAAEPQVLRAPWGGCPVCFEGFSPRGKFQEDPEHNELHCTNEAWFLPQHRCTEAVETGLCMCAGL